MSQQMPSIPPPVASSDPLIARLEPEFQQYLADAQETTRTPEERQQAESEYHQAQYDFTVDTDDTNGAGGIGSLHRFPQSHKQPLRRVVATDEIVKTVTRVHLELGHAKWDAMRKVVMTNYIGIEKADVERVVERCPHCKNNLTRTSPTAPLPRTSSEPTTEFAASARDAPFSPSNFGTDAEESILAADLSSNNGAPAAPGPLDPSPPPARSLSTPMAKDLSRAAGSDNSPRPCKKLRSKSGVVFLIPPIPLDAGDTSVEASSSISARPVAPFEQVELAVIDFEVLSDRGKLQRLVCVLDVASCFVYLHAVTPPHVTDVADVLDKWVTMFGVPPVTVLWPDSRGGSRDLRRRLAVRLLVHGVQDVLNIAGRIRSSCNAGITSSAEGRADAVVDVTTSGDRSVFNPQAGSGGTLGAAPANHVSLDTNKDTIEEVKRMLAAWMEKHPANEWPTALTNMSAKLNTRSLSALGGRNPGSVIFTAAAAARPKAMSATLTCFTASSNSPSNGMAGLLTTGAAPNNSASTPTITTGPHDGPRVRGTSPDLRLTTPTPRPQHKRVVPVSSCFRDSFFLFSVCCPFVVIGARTLSNGRMFPRLRAND
jgi:hypothetical protein